MPSSISASGLVYCQRSNTPSGVCRDPDATRPSDKPFRAASATSRSTYECFAAQVTSQRKGRADWAATVEKMVGFGAKVPDDQFDPLVDYLATHYPAPQ